MCDASTLRSPRIRLTICYIITTVLIASLVYVMLSSALENNRKINRIRDELDDLSHMILHNSVGGSKGDSKQLSEMVDCMIRKRLAGLQDDLYDLKKEVKTKGSCSSFSLIRRTSNTALGDTRINYAAEEIGGKIEGVEAEPLCGTNIMKSLFGMEYSANPPVMMIRQEMNPGNCFAFKDKADVTIRLAKEISIDTIEVEHIAKKYAALLDTSSAPKVFEVYVSKSCRCDGAATFLGKFTYDDSSDQRIQYFPVDCKDKYRFVRFKFLSNSGNPDYTCVYSGCVWNLKGTFYGDASLKVWNLISTR